MRKKKRIGNKVCHRPSYSNQDRFGSIGGSNQDPVDYRKQGTSRLPLDETTIKWLFDDDVLYRFAAWNHGQHMLGIGTNHVQDVRAGGFEHLFKSGRKFFLTPNLFRT